MAVARDWADTSWRMSGCGERCQIQRVLFPGRRFTERLVIHDPLHHEAYGEDVVRRQGGDFGGGITRTGSIEIDATAEVVRVHGRPVYFTPMETGMLCYLASRLGALCTGPAILRAVWGPEYAPELPRGFLSRSDKNNLHLLRVNMARLRSKLGGERRLIETVKGRGYRLLNEPDAETGG